MGMIATLRLTLNSNKQHMMRLCYQVKYVILAINKNKHLSMNKRNTSFNKNTRKISKNIVIQAEVSPVK